MFILNKKYITPIKNQDAILDEKHLSNTLNLGDYDVSVTYKLNSLYVVK